MDSGKAAPDEQRHGSRLREWSRRLLLMLAAFVIAAGVGEAAVRWIYGNRMVRFPRYHSKAIYGDYTLRRLRPNTVFWHTSIDGHWRFATNARGFRNDRDIPYVKTPGRRRVLSVGDSNTEGFEVRQDATFSAVIEQWLSGHDAPAEVINAGISGFGTAEVLAFLENEGINYHPDVVVYGLFANDFDDNVRSGLFALEGESLTVTSKVYAPAVRILDFLNAIPPLRWLSEHSYLYSLAFNSGWTWFKRADVRRARDQRGAEYTKAMGAPNEDAVRLTAALISRMSRFCRTRGILFVVIDIPAWVDSSVAAFTSSIPPSLLEVARRDADVLVLSHELFSPYQRVAGLHVEHGEHHLSEFSHRLLGVRVAQAVRDAEGTCETAPARLQLCSAGHAR